MRAALDDWLACSGPPVTHADVAAELRARVGPKMDERLQRIHAAMNMGPRRNRSLTPSASSFSSSRVIPTHSAPRIAPLPPPVPRPVPRSVPRPEVRPAAPQAAAPAPAASETELPNLFDPDSDSNMETASDMDVPAFLDCVPSIRPSSPPPAVNWEPPRPSPPVEEDESPIELKQYVLAATAGVLVAALLAGGAFLAWRSFTPQPPPASPTVTEDHAAAAQPRAAATPASPGTTSADTVITFRVVPSTATLSVDGQPLPPPGRTLPRIQHGHTATLVAHADGYDDERIQVDESLRGTVDIVLTQSKPK